MSSEVQTTPICIFKRKDKEKERERKELKTCQIMLCTANSRGVTEKSWNPLQKLTQEEASESLGGVWSGVGLDGSPR